MFDTILGNYTTQIKFPQKNLVFFLYNTFRFSINF